MASGCIAGVKSQKGLLLENKEQIIYDLDGQLPPAEGDFVLLPRPPMSIRLKGKPLADNFLLAGPDILGLPFPVIPWLPGIVKAIFTSAQSRVDTSPVEIILSFDTFSIVSRHYGDHPYVIWSLNPEEIELVVKGKTLRASATRVESFSAEYGDTKKGREDTTAQCVSKDESGRVSFSVAARYNGGKCGLVQISVKFDAVYAEVDGGVLRVNGFTIAGNLAPVPETRLRIGSRLRMRLPIIND